MSLENLRLTYDQVGGCDPAATRWQPPPGFRAHEEQVPVAATWEEAVAAVLGWGIKRRSGFAVQPATTHLRAGDRFHLVAHIGPVRVREPVQVVAVVEQPDRVGFAYGTLEGHPVSGEEAFIVSRREGGTVWLTLRSLTRSGRGPWRLAFPLLLVAQRFYRARYRRSLGRAGLRSSS